MRLLALLGLLAATGCASSLSSMQTAKPLARGQVQVSGAAGLFVPASQLVSVVDLGINQGRAIQDAIERGEPYQLSEEDVQRVLTAGVALAVAPPGASNELMLRAGLLEGSDLDVGLRLSASSLRGDLKLRLAHAGDLEDSPLPEHKRKSFDLALGVGLSRHFFRGPVMEVLGVVQLDDFSRWDVEVPLFASADFGDILKLYTVPKYVFGRTSLDQRLVDSAELGSGLSGLDLRLPARVDSHFAGATLGLALGYRFIHFYAELTAGYTWCRPQLFGQARELGGVTLFPAVGIALKNPVSLFRGDRPVGPPAGGQGPALVRR
jgi:hypothetical protein